MAHCKSDQKLAIRCSRETIIGLGSNVCGAWGSPQRTLATALEWFPSIGLQIMAVSENFITKPIGGPRQADFVNAVVVVRSFAAPATLLRGLKRLERQAGRRLGPRWGPRPLDLDLLDVGAVVGWRGPVARQSRVPAKRIAGQLICPHPEMHQRAFVLVPLATLAPHWLHPVLRRSIRTLLEDPPLRKQRKGLRMAPKD